MKTCCKNWIFENYREEYGHHTKLSSLSEERILQRKAVIDYILYLTWEHSIKLKGWSKNENSIDRLNLTIFRRIDAFIATSQRRKIYPKFYN